MANSIIEELQALGEILMGVTEQDAAEVFAVADALFSIEKKMKKNAKDKIKKDKEK